MRRTARAIVLIASLGLVFVWSVPHHSALAEGFVVEVGTTDDTEFADGLCSLREAIIATNTNSLYFECDAGGSDGADTITFNLSSGTPVISVAAGNPLPAIAGGPVTIDGTTGNSDRVEIRGPGGPLVSGHHGLTITGAGVTVRGLVITNSADDGILATGIFFTLLGSYIGVGADGTTPMANQGFGVQVKGASAVIGGDTTGGLCAGDCNVISGGTNLKGNVLLDNTSTGAIIKGNFIGTDVTGTAAAAPATAHGISVLGTGHTIGGTNGITPGGSCTGDCNLISGNSNDGFGFNAGIIVGQAASGITIRGNFIGTNVTGTDPIGNGLGGIGIQALSAGATTIGGVTPAARNVISGNMQSNIEIDSVGSVVQGNYIGTNSQGTAAISADGNGIFVGESDGVVIGGTTPGAGNVISGASTGYPGVSIYRSTNTRVEGNLIGTAADGTTPLPNEGGGIILHNESSNNIIGGFIPAAGNTIAFNENGAGVLVNGSSPPVRRNTIRHNSIHSHAGKGITLGGTTTTGNDGLAAPEITGLDPLTGTACGECFVEIFSDDNDEGRIFEGWVFSDINGDWTFNGPLTGPNVTATATDNSDNTSEFSAPFTLPTPTPTPSPTPTPTPSPTPTVTPTPTASPSPGTELTQGDLNCDGSVDEEDAFFLLEYAAGLTGGAQDAPCPDIGEKLGGEQWGDLNCDGSVDVGDVLVLLLFLADLPTGLSPQCVPPGELIG